MKQNKVVVVISGGVLQYAYASHPETEIVLIDYDNLEEEGKTEDQIDTLVGKATKGMVPVY